MSPPVRIDASVGVQPWLDVRLLPVGPTGAFSYDVRIERPDGRKLAPVVVTDPLDQHSIAEVVAARLAADPEFAYGYNGQPYIWTGTHWSNADQWLQSLSHSMHALIRTGLHTSKSARCLYVTAGKAWAARNQSRTLSLRPYGDGRGIPVLDGVFQVGPTGALNVVPHDPAHGNLHVLPAQSQDVFDAMMEMSAGEGKDTYLMRFLRSSLSDDQLTFMRRWFGLHLVLDHLSHHPQKFVYMYGKGGNGKGVLSELLEELVTSRAVAHLRLSDLKVSSNVERLAGAVSMLSGESSPDTDEDVFKQITAGETVNVNPKYRDPYSLRATCLVTQSSNLTPSFRDVSNAIARRLIAIRMEHRPSEGELIPDLVERVRRDEYPYLAAFALQGAVEVIEAGRLVVPVAIANLSESLARPSRPVDLFYELLEFGPWEVASDELYAAYSFTCRKQRLSFTDKKTFLADLNDLCVRFGQDREVRDKVTGYNPSEYVSERSTRELLVPQLRESSSTEVWFGVRVAEGPLGPAIGGPILPSRRGLRRFLPAPGAAPDGRLGSESVAAMN